MHACECDKDRGVCPAGSTTSVVDQHEYLTKAGNFVFQKAQGHPWSFKSEMSSANFPMGKSYSFHSIDDGLPFKLLVT